MFNLESPGSRGRTGEIPTPCAVADCTPLVFRNLSEVHEDLFRRRRDQDLFLDFEKGFEAWPVVTNDGCPARSRLKNTNARREAGAAHVGAREIECEPLRIVKM